MSATTTAPPLRVSYSTAVTARECEQKYVYRYIDRLKPVLDDATPLHLGTAVHTYLEQYWLGLQAERPPDKSHARAKEFAHAEHEHELYQLSKVAAGLGQDDLARSLLEIVPRAMVLADVYHRVHADDIREHEVLRVEDKFVYPVKEGVVLPGRVDLMTKHRRTGDVYLWEHKTAKRIPRSDTRLSDLQTFLYNMVMEELHGLRADVIMWDYIQTIPPSPPTVLKNGTLSMASNQVTTVEMYVQALKDNRKGIEAKGQTMADYKDAIEAVRKRERETMLVRYELPVLGREDVLLHDYLTTVDDIQRLNADPSKAVRNIGFLCNFCPFSELCKTVLTGGNEESDRKSMFVVEPPRKEEPLSAVADSLPTNEGDPFDGI